jgi:23S rRNA pseudouridine2604 synthase
MSNDGIRLAKRVAELVPCSRAEAERYIAGAGVTVDGVVVEDPATRVLASAQVVLLPGASAEAAPPVTILLHKVAGMNSGVGARGDSALASLSAANLVVGGHGQPRFLKRHLAQLTLCTPLETDASGLLVYTQDFRIVRKLHDDGERVEHEFVVDVGGAIAANGLALLNHGLTFSGKPVNPMKVSWQSEGRLRFAAKGMRPGQIEHMCAAVGLTVTDIKRLRVGRMSMGGLPAGQWRYLTEYERF